MRNTFDRFNGRHQDYQAARPSYAQEFLDWLGELYAPPERYTAADMERTMIPGCRTGPWTWSQRPRPSTGSTVLPLRGSAAGSCVPAGGPFSSGTSAGLHR